MTPKPARESRWLAALLLALLSATAQADRAENLYEDLKDSVYQIRLIDRATEARSAHGSGFLIDDAGVIATNYHVVAEKIRAGDDYRLEYLDADGKAGKLRVIGIDVVNDLALVSGDIGTGRPLPLHDRVPAKGVPLFTLGNPLDLGMSIVEGSYNGLQDDALYRLMLFSGALNAGMSGGPAVNAEGRVVGVNVAATGEDLGFLVPVPKLRSLKERLQERDYNPPDSFDKVIQRQLEDHQNAYMQEVLNGDWPTYDLGPARVPGRLAAFLECAGQSDSTAREHYDKSHRRCASRYEIFVGPDVDTGSISIEAVAYEGAESLGAQRFYNIHEQAYAPSHFDGGEHDFTEFSCRSRLIEAGGTAWKGAFCARRYKRFDGLHDVFIALASVGAEREGVVVKARLNGVTRVSGRRFAEKLLDTVQWRP